MLGKRKKEGRKKGEERKKKKRERRLESKGHGGGVGSGSAHPCNLSVTPGVVVPWGLKSGHSLIIFGALSRVQGPASMLRHAL